MKSWYPLTVGRSKRLLAMASGEVWVITSSMSSCFWSSSSVISLVKSAISSKEVSTMSDCERLLAARSCFKIWALLISASLEREFRKEVTRSAWDCSRVGAST